MPSKQFERNKGARDAPLDALLYLGTCIACATSETLQIYALQRCTIGIVMKTIKFTTLRGSVKYSVTNSV